MAGKEELLGRIRAATRYKVPDILRDAPEELKKDREVVLAAVKQDGGALGHAAGGLKKDREVVLAAVKQNGVALYHAPGELKKDREVVLAAVKQNGVALYHAAGELKKDREVVLAAVKQNGHALDHAAAELKKDREFVLAAVKQNGSALYHAAGELKKDLEVVLAAVKQNGGALYHAPGELKKDREFVLAAVKQNGVALGYAAGELKKDREVVLAAVKQNGHALGHAAAELKKDREFVLAAVKQDGNALGHAAGELKKDREFVLAAVKQNGHALEYAAGELKKDREVVLAAVKQNGIALDHAAGELKKDREFVLAAVKQNGSALEYAAGGLKQDREVVLVAVKENGSALEYAAGGLKQDREVVLAAVKENGNALEYAAGELKGDREVVLAAVAQDARALEHVNQQLRDEYGSALQPEPELQLEPEPEPEESQFKLEPKPELEPETEEDGGPTSAQVQRAAQFIVALAEAHPGITGQCGWLSLNVAGGHLGDAQVAKLLDCASGTTLTSLDLSGNGLRVLPPSISGLWQLVSLDLSDNSVEELPYAVVELANLKVLSLTGNPQLQTAARIFDTKGVPGVQAYVKDCWDDPRPSYTLKTMLVGPSMAGKSSLLKALRKESRRLTRPDERTIGLEIKEIALADPRAKGKVCFVVYDAGGHDEYQEMHQTFLSQATLYILVWNVAMPAPAIDGSDQALEAMETKVADWATLIQTCAPGAKVILVASHADEIADAAEVERRCQRMVGATSRRLEQTYQAQRVELAELQRQAAPEHAGRMRQLQRVVDQPLRLPDHAVVVSADKLDGIPELRAQMLDAAFDTTAFPEFGKAQPNTYVSILRQARKRLENSSSITCEEIQQGLSVPPATGAEQCQCVVRALGFEVSSARVPQLIYLQQVVGAAKVAAWADMRRVLAEHTISDELINSVPTGRRWGLLHQLAYHGAAGEYRFLLEQGISFDGRLPTKDDEPKTPVQVATERGHDDFAATLAALPEWAPSPGMVGRLTLFTGPKSDPCPCRVELSSTGHFEVHLEDADTLSVDLIGEGVAFRQSSKFRFEIVQTTRAATWTFDCGSVKELRDWTERIQPYLPTTGEPHVDYHFAVALTGKKEKKDASNEASTLTEEEEEASVRFTVRHSGAKEVHKQLKSVLHKLPEFPDGMWAWGRDMTKDANAERREQEVLQYYRELFAAWHTWPSEATLCLKRLMGPEISLEHLIEQRCRIAKKVAADPDLVNRAMTYSHLTGEVLFPEFGDRVFLVPQRLVDVMKVMVDHDLSRRVRQLSDSDARLGALGQLFLECGQLDRALLPWLWRDIRPRVVDDPEQIEFIVSLLVEIGLLTEVRGVLNRWLLPLRLPDRREAEAALAARTEFARFLETMGAAPPTGLEQAIQSVVDGTGMPAVAFRHGLEVAFRKADSMIPAGGSCDANGLNRDEIAAINFYTQENTSSDPREKANLYRPMNTALRSQDAAKIRPYWQYIQLLQTAILKLPHVSLKGGIEELLDLDERLRMASSAEAAELIRQVRSSPSAGLQRLVAANLLQGDWSDFVASNPPEGQPGHVVGVEVGKAGVAAAALTKAHRGTGELLYRGIKNPQPPVSMDDVQHVRDAAKPVVWWSFSSTTTSLEVAKGFAGTEERVIYVVSSSRARDVKPYSHLPQEDELIMPCGTSFVISKVSEISPGAIKLELKQTEQVLMDVVSKEVDVFRHPTLAELAATLDSDPAGTDSVQRHFEFHQPLPPGFLAVVLSRCAKQCTEATSVWRRDLLTAVRGDGEDIKEAFEVSVGQRTASRVVLMARCRAGDRHAGCLDALRVFEEELEAVVELQWKGCSYEVETFTERPTPAPSRPGD